MQYLTEEQFHEMVIGASVKPHTKILWYSLLLNISLLLGPSFPCHCYPVKEWQPFLLTVWLQSIGHGPPGRLQRSYRIGACLQPPFHPHQSCKLWSFALCSLHWRAQSNSERKKVESSENQLSNISTLSNIWYGCAHLFCALARNFLDLSMTQDKDPKGLSFTLTWIAGDDRAANPIHLEEDAILHTCFIYMWIYVFQLVSPTPPLMD